MHNPDTGWTEADITINGKPLSFAQSMALRVAVSSFILQMNEPGALGNDETGLRIAGAYSERLSEVLGLIHAKKT